MTLTLCQICPTAPTSQSPALSTFPQVSCQSQARAWNARATDVIKLSSRATQCRCNMASPPATDRCGEAYRDCSPPLGYGLQATCGSPHLTCQVPIAMVAKVYFLRSTRSPPVPSTNTTSWQTNDSSIRSCGSPMRVVDSTPTRPFNVISRDHACAASSDSATQRSRHACRQLGHEPPSIRW